MKLNQLKGLISLALILGLTTLTVSSCAKKQLTKNTEETEEVDDELEEKELDVHDKEFVESKDLQTIYFAYDSSSLSSDARRVLAANASYLKNNTNLEILTEGHCDNRGTIGYNLALGQRRAAVVRKYYISLGIKPEVVGSLSYGKEKPICMNNTASCWNKNRRVITKIRSLNAEKTDKRNTNNLTQEG